MPGLNVAGARPASAPVIAVQEVGFSYDNGTRALASLSFELAAGELIAIVGPSGCGKSTLLKLIAGLRMPTTGRIVRSSGGGRHRCSMVFQDDTLLPWRTVEENVALYYHFKGDRSAAAKAHVKELITMVRLSDYAHFYPHQLSGGMRRRVAILAAIAPLPELLLLDEPFSALDEPTRISIHSELHMLVKQLGISAVLVTHDLTEAVSLSDRVFILSKPPAVVVEEVAVPFGESRDMYDLRDDEVFLRIYGQLWRKLKEQIHDQ